MQTVNIVLLISITSHIKHGQRLKAQHTSQPPFFHQMHQVFSCEHTLILILSALLNLTLSFQI